MILDFVWFPWMALWLVAALIYSWALGRCIHFSLGLFSFLLLSSCIRVVWMENSNPLLGLLAARDALSFILLSQILLFLKEECLEYAEPILAGFCLINSMVILIQTLMSAPVFYRTGLLGNASISASLIAVTLPFVFSLYEFDEARNMLYVLPAAAIFCTQSLSAFLLLFLVCGVYFKRHRFLCVLLFLLCSLDFKFYGPDLFFSDSGRAHVWRVSYEWWREHAHIWLGTGLGSYQKLGPLIQKITRPEINDKFIWMHNDWLQVLFEMGITGLISLLILFLCALRAGVSQMAVFSSVLGYGFFALWNYPAHSAISAIVGFLLLLVSFLKHDESKDLSQAKTSP